MSPDLSHRLRNLLQSVLLLPGGVSLTPRCSGPEDEGPGLIDLPGSIARVSRPARLRWHGLWY